MGWGTIVASSRTADSVGCNGIVSFTGDRGLDAATSLYNDGAAPVGTIDPARCGAGSLTKAVVLKLRMVETGLVWVQACGTAPASGHVQSW